MMKVEEHGHTEFEDEENRVFALLRGDRIFLTTNEDDMRRIRWGDEGHNDDTVVFDAAGAEAAIRLLKTALERVRRNDSETSR